MDEGLLESQMAALPLYQYAFVETGELAFSERVRYICREECPMYGKSWACPPAVGTVAECEARCRAYPKALLLSTVTEAVDGADMAEALAARTQHETVTREVAALVRRQATEVVALSAEACARCDRCSYPDEPCRHPERMLPCVEGHGILITDIAERHGMECFAGNGITWFSLILYRE